MQNCPVRNAIRHISNYNLVIGVIAILLGVYLYYDEHYDNSVVIHSEIYRNTIRYLLPITAFFSMVVSALRLPTEPSYQRLAWARRIIKLNKVVSFFMLAVAIGSILYLKGYFGVVLSQLASVSSFVVLAIISGVVGNLAYDLLKAWYLKSK